MATIDILPFSIGGVKPPMNLLYELFSSKIDSKNLMYPLDLGTNPTYGHAVQFTIYDYQYPAAEAVTGAFNNLDKLTSTLSGNITTESLKGLFGDTTLAEGLKALSPTNLRLQKSNPLSTISLYMPDTLAFDYNHLYNELSLTETLGAPGILASAMADTGSMMQGKDNSMGNYANLVAGPAAYLIDKKLGGLAGNIAKSVPNPQLQLIYKGTGLRQFQFEFRFTPNSKKEAQSIDEIIKNFTYYSVPKLKGAASHQYLEPPQIFNIKFAFTGGSGLSGAVMNFFKNIGTNILTSQIGGNLFGSNPLNQKNNPAPKIFEVYSECVLENMNLDYAPNGWASYDDGYPVETRLTLQFRELDIVTKDNIRPSQSYFGGNGPKNISDAVSSAIPDFDQMFPDLSKKG